MVKTNSFLVLSPKISKDRKIIQSSVQYKVDMLETETSKVLCYSLELLYQKSEYIGEGGNAKYCFALNANLFPESMHVTNYSPKCLSSFILRYGSSMACQYFFFFCAIMTFISSQGHECDHPKIYLSCTDIKIVFSSLF